MYIGQTGRAYEDGLYEHDYSHRYNKDISNFEAHSNENNHHSDKKNFSKYHTVQIKAKS